MNMLKTIMSSVLDILRSGCKEFLRVVSFVWCASIDMVILEDQIVLGSGAVPT